MLSPFWVESKSDELKRVAGLDPKPMAQKLVVVGRIMEECVGGIQLHYKVRAFCLTDRGWGKSVDAAVVRDTFTFGEFELAPWTVPSNTV